MGSNLNDQDHPVSLWTPTPTPYVSCGHRDRQAFYIAVEYIRDGVVVSYGGRFCAVCGGKLGLRIPQDVGPIRVTITDWENPDLVVGVYPTREAA